MNKGTKARRHEGTQGVMQVSATSARTSPFAPSPSLRASVPSCLRASRSAFTLTEILIVIGIIVLLIALAVPAFSLITGGKSIEGATNQLSAALGRARAQAIGLQKTSGVMFFIEPRSQRIHIAIVTEADSVPASVTVASPPEVWLDLADDADFIPLPNGVSAQTICDSAITGATRTSDGYLGYNSVAINPIGGPNNVNTAAAPIPGAQFGGVILFDGAGRLISARYGFKCVNSVGAQSRMGGLLKPTNVMLDMIPGLAAAPVRSQFGLVMFERDPYQTQGFSPTDAQIDGTTYGAANSVGTEWAEEKWLDDNSTPILINRYTGTLVKGE